MFVISIDLGYGWVKGVNSDGKVICIPSFVGSGHERKVADEFNQGVDEMDNIHVMIDGKDYFVGDLAKRESMDKTYTLDTYKISHPMTKVLLATVAAILAPKEPQDTHIVTGLPYGDFDYQKEEMDDFLTHFSIYVHFVSGPYTNKIKKIQFKKHSVLPQAAGALIPRRNINVMSSEYLEGVIDVGYKTCDIVAFETRGKSTFLRTDLCDTIDIAASNVYELLQKAIRTKIGCRLDISQIESAIAKGFVFHRGRRYSIKDEVNHIKQSVAKTIIDMVRAKWRDNTDLMERIHLIGGGSLLLEERLKEIHPETETVENPQMANAAGYLKIIADQYSTDTDPEENKNQEAIRNLGTVKFRLA